jgi:radical SAM superfamily enzyme YgiQ (UPF0313 family)
MIKILLLRPYYGVTIHSDMHGDLGISDYCPAVYPDLSLIYTATIVKESNSFELDIIDANAEKLLPGKVIERLKNEYDLVIIKASEPTIKFDVEFAKYLKKLFPKAKLIMGGHIVKILKKHLENIDGIDELVEIPLENYIYKMVYKEADNVQINEFPSPDYSLFPYKKYIDYSGIMHATIQMSRGCVAKCAYCPYTSFFGRKIEYRTPENVIKDIKNLLDLGISFIQFRDQYFTFNTKNVIKLCQMIINQGLKFIWSCETKIESLNFKLIDLMIEAGMVKINFGIESASKETLKRFNRSTYNIVEIKKLVDYMKNKNIETVAFYIIGFPDDTWESIQNTYNLSTYIGSTYAKFNVYTSIVFRGDSINDIDSQVITNKSIPSSCIINENPSKYLTLEELEYLSNQLAIMYHSSFNGLEEGYKYHYMNQNKFSRTLKMLKNVMKIAQ